MRDSRATVMTAAERIRASHDPADWPGLHHGPITYQRAVEILEWWHSRYIHGSSLDFHLPPTAPLDPLPEDDR